MNITEDHLKEMERILRNTNHDVEGDLTIVEQGPYSEWVGTVHFVYFVSVRYNPRPNWWKATFVIDTDDRIILGAS